MSKITEREKEILKILKNDPMITQLDVARVLKITRSAAAVHISNLIRKGYILGRGYVFNDKSGVLVIGRIFVDILAAKASAGHSASKIDICLGGPAYNISVHLAAQNIPAIPVSVIGRDHYGDIIGEKFNKKGLDTKFLIIQDQFPTPRRLAFIETDQSSEISDGRAIDMLSVHRLQSINVTINHCGMVIIDSGIPEEAVNYICVLSAAAGVPVFFKFNGDVKENAYYQSLDMFDYVMMTMDIAEDICQYKIKSLDDGIEAAQHILKKGVGKTVIILPELGVVMADEDGAVSVPLQPSQKILDRCDVDIITAGVANGIIKSYDYRQSVRLALGAAGKRDVYDDVF
ncbi:PfkB family carbohydrate kinase [Phosphitispora sp. TUW77]|uniref:PfkB family carbohydrate kinase n=1 Tax=Phosphitispora sp. TUW77 TaxID=3152361 RepID=UPI003AB708FB